MAHSPDLSHSAPNSDSEPSGVSDSSRSAMPDIGGGGNVSPAPGGRPVLWRSLVRLAVPSILENLLQSSVYLVDALMLAQVGELELAAVSLTGIFLWRLTEIVACFQKGSSAFVARRWGEGRYDRASRAATHGVALAAVLGLVAVTIVFPFLGWIFRRLGGEERLIPVAVGYATMVLLAFPFTQMFINLSSSVRAAGDTRTPAFATILVNACNVALNYTLIFGHFGFPRLGMQGAGIATGLSLFIGWAFLMTMTSRGLRPRSLFHTQVLAEADDSEKAIEAGGLSAKGFGPAPPAEPESDRRDLEQRSRNPGGDFTTEARRHRERGKKSSQEATMGEDSSTKDAKDQKDEWDGKSESNNAPPRGPAASLRNPHSAIRNPPAPAPVGLLRFTRSGLRLWLPEVTPTILRVTLPTVFEELFISVGFLIFYWMLAQSGTTALAAHSAVGRIESLSFMLGMGFTVSASTLVGQALGRRDVAMARRVFWLCALFAMTFMSALGIGFCLIPRWLLGPFDTGGAFMDIATPLLIIAALEQPMLGAAATMSGGLRGAGDTLSPMISQFFGTIVVRVGVGYYLAFVLELGIQGVYWGTVIDWTVRTLILSALVFGGRWKSIRV